MRRSGVHSFPQRIVLELTPACNLACPMCPRHHIEEHDGFMKMELWKKVVDEVMAEAPDAILLPFWRGESLLHPSFIEAIEYALDRGARIHISTNGQIVEGALARTLARCEFVTFSIHTGAGFENARAFLKLRKGGRPQVQVSFVAGEKTVDAYLDELVAAPDIMGFDSVRLYEEHTKDGVFGKSDAAVQGERTFCPKLVDTLVISSTGGISRCNHIWVPEQAVNVGEVSVREAWTSPVMRRIRDSYPDQKCAPCDQWTGHTCGEVWRKADGMVKHQVYHLPGSTAP